jgi:hypothetical protein
MLALTDGDPQNSVRTMPNSKRPRKPHRSGGQDSRVPLPNREAERRLNRDELRAIQEHAVESDWLWLGSEKLLVRRSIEQALGLVEHCGYLQLLRNGFSREQSGQAACGSHRA